MGHELGRALLLADAVTPDAMARALLASVRDRVSLVRALLATNAITMARLEEELALTAPEAPFERQPVPLLELVERLPPYLCEALVAIPFHADEQTGTIDVALADAGDAHAAEEIGFFLESPVRVVRSPLGAIEAAISQVRHESVGPPSPPISVPPPSPVRPMQHTPPWGSTPIVQVDDRAGGDDAAPIPLSRRLAAGAGLLALARAAQEIEDQEDLVVELRRSKPPSKRAGALPTAHDHEREAPPTRSTPDERSAALRRPTPLNEVLTAMTLATARDPLMELVLVAVTPMAPKSALFAVKKDSYTGLMCTSEFGARASFAEVRIDAKQSSLLSTTATVGTYVGPMPRTQSHAPLAPFIATARSANAPKVIGVTIKAAGRPAALLIAHEVGEPLRAMTVFSEVAQVAGEALERILRARR